MNRPQTGDVRQTRTELPIRLSVCCALSAGWPVSWSNDAEKNLALPPYVDPRMLNVFLTVDVEIWCDGWADIDRKFPQAFRSYIYGPTPSGEYGLRYQAELLRAHGLNGVFFVESLFTCRFGNTPLSEIVGVLRDAGQEI